MKKLFDATKTIFLRVKILLPLLILSIIAGFFNIQLGCILVAFSFLAYGFVKLAIVRPIRLLQQAIDRKGDGSEFSAISTPGRDEIEQLAETINRILGQLTDSEEKFRQIVESIQGVFWMTTPDRSKMLYISPAFEEMWGITIEELYKDPDLRFQAIISEDKKCLELLHQNNSENYFDLEFRINRRPDGKIVWIHDRGYPVKDERGKIIAIAGISTDISERKRAEEALLKSESHNHELIKALEIANTKALQAAQVKGDFLANMSHEIRTPMNGVIGTLELLGGTSLDKEQQEYVATATKSAEFLLELINDVLDFSKIEAGKLNINPSIINLMVVIEDVVEMLAMKAEEKGVDLSFRYDRHTPINIVADPSRIKQVLVNLIGNAVKFTERGHVFINVESQHLSSEKGTFAISIEDSGIGIPEDKIENIFETFTQVDSSTSRRFGGTGLGLTICRQIARLMGGSIEVKSQLGMGSTFTFNMTVPLAKEAVSFLAPTTLRDLHLAVVDDNEGNQRILHELITAQGNRCEIFSSAQQALGAIQRSWETSDPIRMVLIDKKLPLMDGEMLGRKIKTDPLMSKTELIMMTTIGDSPNFQKIKLAGFSGHLIKPIRPSQLVIGLTQIWEEHLKREARMGLPQGMPEDSNKNIESKKSEEQSFSSEILLVEDTAINQQVAVRMLEKLGCQVEVAVNGLEALEKIKKYPYSLILMDCQMPEMDGYRATREIREFEKSTNTHLPIIAMTAHALEGDREKCLEAGMDDYISKPIKSASFVRVLKEWNRNLDVEVIESLAELNGQDGDFQARVIREFISDTANRLETFTKVLIEKDFKQARTISHAIRGSAGTMGVQRLYALCTWFEALVEDDTMELRATRLLEGMNKEFSNVKEILTSYGSKS